VAEDLNIPVLEHEQVAARPRPRAVSRLQDRKTTPKRIAFFGHFDSSNFGNESTLQAILYHLRCFHPDAEVICISTGRPEAAVVSHEVEIIPITRTLVKWRPRSLVLRVVRRVCIEIPIELYGWVSGLITLRRIDMLIIPGTGLLTDAYGLRGWAPYDMFKWSLIAKVCRCKLIFVSVGAGPIYRSLGRRFVKSALSLANFRSYRDKSTMQYLMSIGYSADKDRVYPDLVFSLPVPAVQKQVTKKSRRSVVGLGLMSYAGKYSVARPSNEIYLSYLENLVKVVKWLLAHEYDVRLLNGDLGDVHARQEFKDLLKKKLSPRDEDHIIDEPVVSVENLLSQIAATDIVVATRFHNVLLALLCNKPVISISFHHKCVSLMSAMGLSAYCLDINDLKADALIAKFCDLETKASKLKPLIGEKVGEFRKALDEQYRIIFNDMWPG
jgi:polysaccharide pyruvyl transferase WcaK-like protein